MLDALRNLIIRLISLPLALLYGLVVSLRLFAYRVRLLKSYRFDVPVLTVGNLTAGGSGKTPHVEYLVRLLDPYLRIGILSRGYGRKTYGYINVQDTHTAADVGDEPLQYRKKFPEMLVAVGEQRAFAIPRMLSDEPKLQTILLDDAYQHQAVQAGLTVLLTEYRHPYSRDFLLPLGRLREYRSGYKRADIIVVTKCPDNLTQADADALMAELKPLPHQKVFFSKYRYGQPYHLFRPDDKITLSRRQSALLICGIAKTDYLTDYLARAVKSAYLYDFDDHHYFDTYDVGRLQGIFENLSSEDEKIILTTEKDATRLLLHAPYLEGVNLPIYVLPIEVEFLFGGSTQFDETIRQFLLDFKV